MPTEITSEARRLQSRVVETSRVQQQKAVIEADRIDARQTLSENEQTVPPARESGQPSPQQLEKATDELNTYVQSLQRDLHFSVNDDTGETIIRVVDSETQKTIRTIPSDEFIEASTQLSSSVGKLLNATV